MGRPAIDFDMETLYDVIERNPRQIDAARELEVSAPTLARKIAAVQENQGLLLQYRTLQSLELTSLQSRILEAITPEKIAEASLKDLVSAFKILKEKEHLIEGKPSEIKGLVGYLVEMEKEELALQKQVNSLTTTKQDDEVQDADFEDDLPDL